MDSANRDRLAQAFVGAAVLPVLLVFAAIIFHLAQSGLSHLDLQFLIAAPEDSGRSGGIWPILVSTLYILGVCLSVAFPLSLGCAIWLSYSQGHPFVHKTIRRCLTILAGVPSIVFGLFGNMFFSIYLGMGFSILSGGLTLACMVIPLLTYAAEEGIREAAAKHRSGGLALGLSEQAVMWRIILPSAAPALAAGSSLALGRALGETAALLFTSGYVDRMPSSIWDSGRSLSIHIYDLAMNVPGGEPAALATGLLMVGLLFILNGIVYRIGFSS